MSDPEPTVPLRAATSVAIVGFVLFTVALVSPCIDTKFAEMGGAGHDVRGYQCFVGCFLAPMVSFLGIPLWIALDFGNVGVLLCPFMWGRGSISRRMWRFVRFALLFGVIGAVALRFVGKEVGISRLHWGANLWTLSLVLLCVAVWLPRRNLVPVKPA